MTRDTGNGRNGAGESADSNDKPQETERRHLYLITEHPEDEYVGLVEDREQQILVAEKNVETRVDKRDLDTGESYSMQVVSLGYHDFPAGYSDEEFLSVVNQKLGEINAEHLEKAGLEPAEVTA